MDVSTLKIEVTVNHARSGYMYPHLIRNINLTQKLHKRPDQSRLISNESHCSTTILSKHITSAFSAGKGHVMKDSETVLAIAMSITFGPLKTLPRLSMQGLGYASHKWDGTIN